jgi:hypothetical protein
MCEDPMSIDIPESRLEMLQRENERLLSELRELERDHAQLRAAEDRRAFSALETIVATTRRIFHSDVVVQVDSDPEHADEKYLTLRVSLEAPTTELLRLERQWIEELREPLRHWQCGLLIRPL